jgi:hypothetical protein
MANRPDVYRIELVQWPPGHPAIRPSGRHDGRRFWLTGLAEQESTPLRPVDLPRIKQGDVTSLRQNSL